MNKFKPPKGTKDYLPEEMKKRRWVMENFREIFEKYGYEEVCTPAFEYLELLEMKDSLGQENVKDIYKFQDKAGRWLGLRFDMTTPIARIVATHPDMPKPIKWYYIANMWRYENPQCGRLREFWQAGIENIGIKDEMIDAEILAVTYEALKRVGVKDFYFMVNARNLMDKICKHYKIKNTKEFYRILDKKLKLEETEWKRKLKEYFPDERSYEKFLELVKNPWDEIVEKILPFSKDEVEYLEKIIDYAKEFGVKDKYIVIDISIIRGLDYYTDFIFETYKKGEENLGSLASGGRYDNLIEIYGGQKTPATGMAIGIERMMEIISNNISVKPRVDVFILPLDDSFKKDTIKLATILRKNGISCDYEIMRKKLKKKLSYADSLGVRYCILLGANEIKDNIYSLRDMEKNEQYKVTLDELIRILKREV